MVEYIFIVLCIILALVVWSILNEKSLNQKIKNLLKEQWGEVPEEEYTSEKFESLKSFYKSVQDDQLDVDDITWNDLDLDEIFMQMNNTQSAIGEEYLYALLHKPCFSTEELEERNRLIHFFQEKEEERVLLQTKLYPIGKLSNISVYHYISRLDEQEPQSNVPHYVMAIGLILSILTIFIHPGIGLMLTIFFLINNIFRYYARKADIDMFLTVFSYIIRLLDSTKQITKLPIPEIETYLNCLRDDVGLFKKFRKGSDVLTSKKASGGFIDTLLDYVRMLFHVDLIKYNTMLNFLKKNCKTLDRIFINIGLLDSMMAAASFRDMMDYYCEPELIRTTKHKLNVMDLYHPLLETPIPNTITENQSVLITGSNASGKSTFIKTLAINAILAQTIYTSLSKRYQASYFMIYSSMALKDNLFSNDSYYIVEIKSLKRILDRINNDIPILCFIDEVLRGTNTLERIAASSHILLSLAKRNALVFAATHDIELTHILEDYYSNYHFQERIVENKIIFDYKLYQGRAVSKNAIKLLGLLGYSKDIIDAAENAAEEFLTNGEWKKI